MRIVAAFFIIGIIFGLPISAQDLEVFKFEDFVDPEVLQGMSERKGEPLYFLASDIHLGYISNYQSRSSFLEEDAFFLRISNNLYYKDWQFGLKATSFGDKRDMVAIGNRLTLDFAKYFSSSVLVAEEDSQYVVDRTSRLRFSWDSRYLQNEQRANSFSTDLDIRLDGPPKRPFFNLIGGYNYTWVKATEVDDGHDQHYLSFSYRTPIQDFANRTRLIGGYALGIERTRGHSRWGALRVEIGYEIPIPQSENKLRLVYAPAYQLDRGDFNQEISVLFNPPLFTALGQVPWRRASKARKSP